MTKHPKRISAIDHRTDGAVFAGIHLHLKGLRLRLPFKYVLVWKHFAIRAVAVFASEFEASDFTTVTKHFAETTRSKARSLVAPPAAGSHEHGMASRLP
ncbi:hypothetical protein [Candidatus Phyllobacterium onerii]|uniref:hypothetical protein n=1 Tax=Candidatus Phyllobacterium onerii TaxID=3020828 RepID=UPI00232F5BDE|nr:hypothetical protein [Phyllobacterium sp. IY22]